jgi:hypothetical protein
MIFRKIALSFSAVVLCAASEPPPPPVALEPYLKDGHFEPGDYGWFRGRFQDATADQNAAYQALLGWANDCRLAAIADLREQLVAAGFPDAQLENTGPGPLLCRAVMSQPMVTDNASFAAFERGLAVAGPMAQAYLVAARNADEAARPHAEDLGRQLEHRIVGEQVIRLGLSWVGNRDSDFPQDSPLTRAIVQSRLIQAMAEYDHANTEWLKGVVAEHGWPRKSEVGEGAASAAWLLVQHADADPLFQLQALRLMEPLVAQGEVSGRDFAYLTDRVALKLTGKQRYGTQFTCVDGHLAPLPVEDEGAVDRLRREAGMETQAENAARMDASYGRCG